jgi:hypothetical protein
MSECNKTSLSVECVRFLHYLFGADLSKLELSIAAVHSPATIIAVLHDPTSFNSSLLVPRRHGFVATIDPIYYSSSMPADNFRLAL